MSVLWLRDEAQVFIPVGDPHSREAREIHLIQRRVGHDGRLQEGLLSEGQVLKVNRCGRQENIEVSSLPALQYAILL
jgi:hypothetical protein